MVGLCLGVAYMMFVLWSAQQRLACRDVGICNIAISNWGQTIWPVRKLCAPLYERHLPRLWPSQIRCCHRSHSIRWHICRYVWYVCRYIIRTHDNDAPISSLSSSSSWSSSASLLPLISVRVGCEILESESRRWCCGTSSTLVHNWRKQARTKHGLCASLARTQHCAMMATNRQPLGHVASQLQPATVKVYIYMYISLLAICTAQSRHGKSYCSLTVYDSLLDLTQQICVHMYNAIVYNPHAYDSCFVLLLLCAHARLGQHANMFYAKDASV